MLRCHRVITSTGFSHRLRAAAIILQLFKFHAKLGQLLHRKFPRHAMCWRLQLQQPLPACAPIARDTSRDGPAPASRPRALRRSVGAASIGRLAWKSVPVAACRRSNPGAGRCRSRPRSAVRPPRYRPAVPTKKKEGVRDWNGAPSCPGAGFPQASLRAHLTCAG